MEIFNAFFRFSFCGLLIFIVVFAAAFLIHNKRYKKCSYYKITKNSYLSTRFDIGKYGEYLTYKHLQYLEKNGAKFLFNVYIPKENNETTEIDVLLICSKGIFVFESKNYSGWIFGKENQLKWTQTLPQGKGKSHKEHFYNPIMQNKTHIKYLQNIVGKSVPMYSLIVFSDRCTLKDVIVHCNDVWVINRRNVESSVASICNEISEKILTENEITEIYEKVLAYTQVDNSVKIQHIQNINEKIILKSDGFLRKESDTDDVNTLPENEPLLNETNEKLCPKCGGKLVVRIAKRGRNTGKQFLGCSNYPNCKYICDIDNS